MKTITAPNLIAQLSKTQSRCLLIGATTAGRVVYKALSARAAVNPIACWTDKKYHFFALCGLPISLPEEIKNVEIDTVIIAGNINKPYALQIIHTFQLNNLPCYLLSGGEEQLEDFEYPNLHYTDEPVDENDLYFVHPVQFITADRLDLVIRYLACKEILDNAPAEGVRLYEMLTISMNNGEEYVRPFTTCAYFSTYESKKGFDAFYRSFRELIASMSEKGFLKEHFIPVSENWGVINGTHRLACALALNKKVYVKRYIGFGEPFLTFDIAALKRIGCTEEQIALVLDAYNNLKKHRGESK